MLNKKILVIFGFVILIVALAILFSANSDSVEDYSSPETNEYTDPFSGEVITDPDGKSPETYGGGGVPILGLGELLKRGVTQDQIQGFKQAVEEYKTTKNGSINEVSVVTDTIKNIDTSNDEKSFGGLTFDVVINRKERLGTRMEYSGLSTIRISFTDKNSGKTIFKSSGEHSYYD